MEQTETFYNELKQLRIAQGITLESISATSRINIRFLNALEEGDFTILPKTYIRLFLRSYCNEIGASFEEAATNLEEHLGNYHHGPEPFMEDLSKSITPGIDKASKEPKTFAKKDPAIRTPARLQNDFIAAAAIFVILILIVVFAQSITRDEPVQSQAQPSATLVIEQPNVGGRESGNNVTPNSASGTTPRQRPVIPVESSVELPDELFTQDRINAHLADRLDLTPPVRLTLRARDNVVLIPILNGRKNSAINLTVSEARVWRIEGNFVIRTNAIDHLRGDLNGIPLDFGNAKGVGTLTVTPSGQYEVASYGPVADEM